MPPNGRILKSDTAIAKNYLDEKQIRQLEQTVSGYFDYIEDLIERENTFTMQEFARASMRFLSFRRYEILPRDAFLIKEQWKKACRNTMFSIRPNASLRISTGKLQN